MYQKKYHIYFVGIGGIGMSGIAELLLNLGFGYQVLGDYGAFEMQGRDNIQWPFQGEYKRSGCGRYVIGHRF